MRGQRQFEAALAGDNFRIIPIHHPTLRIYAKNAGGRPAMLIELTNPLEQAVSGTRGIQVAIDAFEAGKKYLRFESENPGLPVLFENVADSLLAASEGGKDEDEAVRLVLETFADLQTMFAKRTDRLSETAIRGLFAEVRLILDMREGGQGPLEAMRSWKGPYRAAKDFALTAGRCIEVKSIRRLNSRVTISNVDQLDPKGEVLRLAVLELEHSDDDQVASLLGILAELREWTVSVPEARGLLDDALEQIGLDETDPYYEQWRFTVGEWRWFSIEDGFPRIRAEDVPLQVSGVTYALDLGHLGDYASVAFWAEKD